MTGDWRPVAALWTGKSMNNWLLAAVPLLVAVTSGWLVEGGIARRSRRAIREELELRNLLGEDTVEGRAMHAKVRRRVARYARIRYKDTNFERVLRESEQAPSWVEILVIGATAAALAYVSVSLFFQGLGLERTDAGDWVQLVLFSVLSGLILAMAGMLGRGSWLMLREKRAVPVISGPIAAPTEADRQSESPRA